MFITPGADLSKNTKEIYGRLYPKPHDTGNREKSESILQEVISELRRCRSESLRQTLLGFTDTIRRNKQNTCHLIIAHSEEHQQTHLQFTLCEERK